MCTYCIWLLRVHILWVHNSCFLDSLLSFLFSNLQHKRKVSWDVDIKENSCRNLMPLWCKLLLINETTVYSKYYTKWLYNKAFPFSETYILMYIFRRINSIKFVTTIIYFKWFVIVSMPQKMHYGVSSICRKVKFSAFHKFMKIFAKIWKKCDNNVKFDSMLYVLHLHSLLIELL